MKLDITPIPALKDNYIWMISSSEKKLAIVVDPGEAKPVLTVLNQNNLSLAGILVTHHHWDHTDGIPELLKNYDVPVYGPGLKSGVISTALTDFTVLEIPGHTLDHIAFVGLGGVFCGDTLFCAGCGKVFEGTYEQMYESLLKLKHLPDETLVYCGHEYTQSNLKFAKVVESNNPNFNLQKTAPSTIKLEKLTNPFLRCEEFAVREAVEKQAGRKLNTALEVFTELRKWKDKF
jgi:hydroxyacylglutathione hydrolase